MQKGRGQEGSNEQTWNVVGKTGGGVKELPRVSADRNGRERQVQLWNKTTQSTDSGAWWPHTMECPQNGGQRPGRFNRLRTAFIVCKGIWSLWRKTDCLEMLHLFLQKSPRWNVSAGGGGRPTPLRFSKRSGETREPLHWSPERGAEMPRSAVWPQELTLVSSLGTTEESYYKIVKRFVWAAD